MRVLNGREVAQFRTEGLRERIEKFRGQFGRPPGLGVILVGEDPASRVYVHNKGKSCRKVGMESFEINLPVETSQETLEEIIRSWNQKEEVDGFLVQLPLPKGLSSESVLDVIDPRKDPDGLTPENLGLLWSGKKRVASCTPSGVMALLDHYGVELAGKRAVVLGRSNIVGKPMAQLLLDAQATVSICHSRTPELGVYTQEADIVVVAIGKPRFIGVEMFKQGAVVIDVGIHRLEDGKLCGDVHTEGVEQRLAALSPVPGGVGPMTIQMLLENTVTLAEQRALSAVVG